MKYLFTFFLLLCAASAVDYTYVFHNPTVFDQNVRIRVEYHPGASDQNTFLISGVARHGQNTTLTNPNGGTVVFAEVFAATGELVANSYNLTGVAEWLTLHSTDDSGSVNSGFTQDVFIENSTRPENPDNEKTLWVVTDDTLTADLYKEGVDKTVAFLKKATEASQSSGGGSSTDQTNFYGEQARLANFTNATEDAQSIYTESGAAAMAADAKNAIRDSITDARSLPSFGNETSPSAPSIMDMTLPLPTGNKTMHLDPASNDSVATFAVWLKKVIAWVVYVSFQIFVWNYFSNVYLILSGTQPAKGNPVAAGSGAQATSLLVAILITGVLLSFPALFWTLADSGLTWASGITENPLEAAQGGAVFLQIASYLIHFFVPVGTVLAALSSYFLVLRGGLVLLAGVQTLVRFFIL